MTYLLMQSIIYCFLDINKTLFSRNEEIYNVLKINIYVEDDYSSSRCSKSNLLVDAKKVF